MEAFLKTGKLANGSSKPSVSSDGSSQFERKRNVCIPWVEK